MTTKDATMMRPRPWKLRPAAAAATFLALACSDSTITGPPPPLSIEEVEFAPELGIDLAQMEERPSGLWLRDEEDGEGLEAGEEDWLTVDYEGWLPDGTLFDTSLDGDPLVFSLAEITLIAGFAEAVLGMRAGGERLILVPPALGYGAQQVPTPRAVIPPNSWLVFRIFMRDVEREEQD
jgi:FKBP-type peptidyl-prolyl cis-trans isomerase FkpA